MGARRNMATKRTKKTAAATAEGSETMANVLLALQIVSLLERGVRWSARELKELRKLRGALETFAAEGRDPTVEELMQLFGDSFAAHTLLQRAQPGGTPAATTEDASTD